MPARPLAHTLSMVTFTWPVLRLAEDQLMFEVMPAM